MFFKSKNKRLQNDKGKLLENFPSNSSYAESYRTLRTNLFFSLTGKDLESVVVTSSVEGEGKTTTSTNLGYTVAQTSRKVLLVDLDLRNPQMSKLFHLEDAAGITDLISDVFGIHLTQGSLDTFSVNDLIQLARLQRMTCLLKLENEKIH
ncbi:MAG: CpsD/CapB family tyrosine-protein kinase, partial [Desulfobacteraceae bacterium]|nr:CpsD/CapB family tyrosine-protein kinase [Desulfobacteraceae bacterium]